MDVVARLSHPLQGIYIATSCTMLSRRARTGLMTFVAALILLVLTRRSTDETNQLLEPGRRRPAQHDDWSQYAYVQYVTTPEYLCNSVMIFEALHRLGSRPERVMLYPRTMMADPMQHTANGRSRKLLIKARDEYGVNLVPIDVQHRDNEDDREYHTGSSHRG